MGRTYRDQLSVVFLLFFILAGAFIYWRTGGIDFVGVGGFAAFLTACFAARVYIGVRPELKRLRDEREAAHKLQAAKIQTERERQFGLACVEIARMMSRLSLADISVFVTANKFANGENGYSFRTAKGSPVHSVLVALTDVNCANPLEMKPVERGAELSLATYELTGLGKHLLPRFLNDAQEFRSSERH